MGTTIWPVKSRRSWALLIGWTDLLTGWLKAELGIEPKWPALQEFCGQQLRRDLMNLGLYAWTARTRPGWDGQDLAEALSRLGRYLVEQDYLSSEQLPTLVAAMAQMVDDGIVERL